MQCLNFFWSDARQAQHLDQTGCNLGFEIGVEGKFAGSDQRRDFVSKCFTDATNVGKLAGRNDLCQIFFQLLDGPRGVSIGVTAEGIFTLKFE